MEAPVAFEIFVERMRKELQEPIRVWRNNRKKVFRVGVLTGAGDSSDHIQFAVKHGCDTYVTGEASLYTIQYAKYLGINLLVGSQS
ncbi:hypothetical protein J6TS2_15130 [Heyndrickxia sporothermodurans]|nr:hypothetical protein J6TS2_15130 [Heyndrickxia sporothermodurans]